jgi:hypothetical protein
MVANMTGQLKNISCGHIVDTLSTVYLYPHLVQTNRKLCCNNAEIIMFHNGQECLNVHYAQHQLRNEDSPHPYLTISIYDAILICSVSFSMRPTLLRSWD